MQNDYDAIANAIMEVRNLPASTSLSKALRDAALNCVVARLNKLYYARPDYDFISFMEKSGAWKGLINAMSE